MPDFEYNVLMVRNLAKKAMTTTDQKICYVIDHLVEALGNDPSSSLRRALILTDIDQYPGTTQTGVMERLGINKSALTREIDWLFNYGCIMRQESKDDGRAVKLQTYGYSQKGMNDALSYFDNNHASLKKFLEKFIKIMKMEKPTLRDAKIIAVLEETKGATKQQVLDRLYEGAASTENRAINDLIREGVVKDARE
jgi:DNA-binding MarR family transcriptional regulator